MHSRKAARLVPAFAALDLVLALAQTTASQPWFRWVGLALIVAVLVLSVLEAFRGKHVARPLAIAATALATIAAIDFAQGTRRLVDHVSLLAMCATAVVAWSLLFRGVAREKVSRS
jgi:hypothetical protein